MEGAQFQQLSEQCCSQKSDRGIGVWNRSCREEICQGQNGCRSIVISNMLLGPHFYCNRKVFLSTANHQSTHFVISVRLIISRSFFHLLLMPSRVYQFYRFHRHLVVSTSCSSPHPYATQSYQQLSFLLTTSDVSSSQFFS